MRPALHRSCYKYIAVYVDDLGMALKDPAKFCKELRELYKYKLKGDGPMKYHLGCDYERDDDGTLRMGPRKYIKKMQDTYKCIFEEEAKHADSPLVKGDHPEMDNSELCDEKGMATYQTMIGQIQWVVALGRIDVFVACMTMSRWRAAPRIGHLERVKRIYGYLDKFEAGYCRVETDEPDLSHLPEPTYDWGESIYGKVREEIPDNAPNPLG